MPDSNNRGVVSKASGVTSGGGASGGGIGIYHGSVAASASKASRGMAWRQA